MPKPAIATKSPRELAAVSKVMKAIAKEKEISKQGTLLISSFHTAEEAEEFAAPQRMNPTDAGLDLTVSRYLAVAPLTVARVPHNLVVAIPEGFFGLLVARSAAFMQKGLIVHSGTIDSGYRGEVQTLVFNPRPRTIHINPGERISQLILLPVVRMTISQVEKADMPESDRGAKGFGSTGGIQLGSPADNQEY